MNDPRETLRKKEAARAKLLAAIDKAQGELLQLNNEILRLKERLGVSG